MAGTDYVPHSADDVRSMLAAVGVAALVFLAATRVRVGLALLALARVVA